MPRKSDSVPSYRLHRASGQAIVTVPLGCGRRKDYLLGPYGSPESRQEYLRVIGEWEANGRRSAAAVPFADLTISELLDRFWEHAAAHYRRPDGTPSQEQRDYADQIKLLRQGCGHTLARDFGPLAFKAVREQMIAKGWCRKIVNQRMGRVRRIFKWGVENELFPVDVLQRLMAVRGLQAGRCAAPDHPPIRPVDMQAVEATLPHMRPQVAAMVRLQLATGMRPGEVTAMRTGDLVQTCEIWRYTPPQHKTAWQGHKRVIFIGPQGQAILKPWLRLNLQEFLFQPRESVAAFRAERRSRRKSKIQPSQLDRRRAKPKKQPRERYTTGSYRQAIAKACQRAGISSWHPHQLRHLKATEIRSLAGLDAARVVLGHLSPSVTEVYAELDQGKAAELMKRIG